MVISDVTFPRITWVIKAFTISLKVNKMGKVKAMFQEYGTIKIQSKHDPAIDPDKKGELCSIKCDGMVEKNQSSEGGITEAILMTD